MWGAGVGSPDPNAILRVTNCACEGHTRVRVGERSVYWKGHSGSRTSDNRSLRRVGCSTSCHLEFSLPRDVRKMGVKKGDSASCIKALPRYVLIFVARKE